MKVVSLAILLTLTVSLEAQITITQYDLPSVNDTLHFKIGNISNFDPNVTGADQTWDFSMITLSNERVDTIIPVTSTPLVYNAIFNFTVANLAYINQSPPSLGIGITVSDYYDFYKKSSSYYRKAGFGATINNIPTPVKYDNPELYFALPLTYGTSDSSISKYGFTLPNYGYYGQTIYRKHEADGWGTIITPYGSYNAIRVKATVNIIDTIYNESSGLGYTLNRPISYEYYWLSNGLKTHVAKITQHGRIYTIEILYNPVNYANSNIIDNISIAPNPVKDYLYINSLPEGTKSISLFNTLGQTILQKETTKNNFIVNLTSISNGIYELKIVSENLKYSKRIFVNH